MQIRDDCGVLKHIQKLAQDTNTIKEYCAVAIADYNGKEEGKEEFTMLDIAEELENRGKAVGLAEGKIEGLLLAKTILKLDADGKSISEIAMECDNETEKLPLSEKACCRG